MKKNQRCLESFKVNDTYYRMLNREDIVTNKSLADRTKYLYSLTNEKKLEYQVFLIKSVLYPLVKYKSFDNYVQAKEYFEQL